MTTESSEKGLGMVLRGMDPLRWISGVRLWPGPSASESMALARPIELLLPGVSCEKSDLLDNSPITDVLAERLEPIGA